MNNSTTSLSFPDVNVWLAILHEDHVHRENARRWWQSAPGAIAFTRFTMLGVLRLMTTASVMQQQPLSMDEAWRAYERLFADDRVVWQPEPTDVDRRFREYSAGRLASPKLWADAWLLAVAHAACGVLVTFDWALAQRAGPHGQYLDTGAPA